MAEVTGADLVRYRGGNEWSALYVNGKLDRVGDHYWVEERIFELLGVTEEYSDSFMRGGDNRESVAKTLDEIEEYDAALEQAEDEAEELLDRAADLMRQANALLAEAKGGKR